MKRGSKASGEAPALRRPARTEQGRAIVDSLLEAAERVVAQAGSVNAIRMNDLARLAGVSVGSVYHYFPNRQAIIAELARRLEGRGLELAAEALGSVGQQTSLEAVRSMVKLLGSSRLGDRAMRRSLLRDVPASWIEDESKSVDETVQGVIIELLKGRPAEMDRYCSPDPSAGKARVFQGHSDQRRQVCWG